MAKILGANLIKSQLRIFPDGESKITLMKKPQKNKIRYISTVDGKELAGDQLNANYWWRNIRQPVKFHSAIDE